MSTDLTEQWNPVSGWEGYYEVSDDGQVKSLARSVPGRPGVLINKRERRLKPGIDSSGYPVFWFTKNNKRTEYRAHSLVLAAFIGPRPEGAEACHNDGDKSNNHVDNLRWDTRSANTFDKVRHGAHPMASKTHCKHGHEFTTENTYRPARGGRHCLTCVNTRKRAYRAAARAERTAA